MNSYFKKIIFLTLFFIFLTPLIVFAISIEPVTKCKTIEECVNAIIDLIFWIALAIVPLMIIVAGFYFITSAGNPEKIRKAKDIIFWTIIGLLIILLAKGIISAIREVIAG